MEEEAVVHLEVVGVDQVQIYSGQDIMEIAKLHVWGIQVVSKIVKLIRQQRGLL